MATTKKELKAGWKSSEFWMLAIAQLCALAYASGAIAPEGTSTGERIVALVAGILASLGYNHGRATLKAAAEENK